MSVGPLPVYIVAHIVSCKAAGYRAGTQVVVLVPVDIITQQDILPKYPLLSMHLLSSIYQPPERIGSFHPMDTLMYRMYIVETLAVNCQTDSKLNVKRPQAAVH